jgi:hypothetical protein
MYVEEMERTNTPRTNDPTLALALALALLLAFAVAVALTIPVAIRYSGSCFPAYTFRAFTCESVLVYPSDLGSFALFLFFSLGGHWH